MLRKFRKFVALTMASAALAGPSHGWAADRSDKDKQEYSGRLETARLAYFKVIVSNDQDADAQAHQALAALEREYPGDPVAKAYHGSLELLDAAHNWAVWNLHKQASEGLTLLDEAVTEAPDEPEARFIRAATSWHLPGFYRRKAQCESDFALLAGRAEHDVQDGKLPPELAAASYNYWGQILANRNDMNGARTAYQAAVRIAAASPGGMDAGKRLAQLK